jgi:hypothetical protein
LGLKQRISTTDDKCIPGVVLTGVAGQINSNPAEILGSCPAAAKAATIPKPIPLFPPVTIAVFPDRSNAWYAIYDSPSLKTNEKL